MTQRDQRGARGDDIDAHLRRAFQQLTDETLPDRFTDLLERLRAGEGAEASSDTDQPDRETVEAVRADRNQ
ncbi:NepR family anti-sigma factor [Limimaricola pyoseonensis]|uniref:Anti-sigma factor NepR domain-containing protein n=1 Tax=Limimaricola pyoseonensis TaxID=521013 RepID=A0A1G6ZKM6_9RHOB|nr:NepR family anti-sigma factor [Limimaricola pyoseonensis]SDE03080.1 hypothetical protein SAMN04488567_0574 [Limimaricola pyoseonensis]